MKYNETMPDVERFRGIQPQTHEGEVVKFTPLKELLPRVGLQARAAFRTWSAGVDAGSALMQLDLGIPDNVHEYLNSGRSFFHRVAEDAEMYQYGIDISSSSFRLQLLDELYDPTTAYEAFMRGERLESTGNKQKDLNQAAEEMARRAGKLDTLFTELSKGKTSLLEDKYEETQKAFSTLIIPYDLLYCDLNDKDLDARGVPGCFR
jgi:hypothetical protein